MSEAGYAVGWWIESADEEIYGPVSRQTLQKYLHDGVISRNTLVRHCTQEKSRPVVDQPGVLNGSAASASAPITGDRLADAWPRRRNEQLELATSELPCAFHRSPAVAVCLRCQGSYCRKCQMKPYNKTFFFCKRCQANHNNRRFLAILIDGFLVYFLTMLIVLPLVGIASAITPSEESPTGVLILSNLVSLGLTILYMFRDVLMNGSGPGKRVVGLRVVRSADGVTPLGYGQAIIRFLPLMVPVFPLIELVLIYRDPLMRRFGDRWAKTRVIDTQRKLDAARARVRFRLDKKGVGPLVSEEQDSTLEQFAQIAE